MKFRVLFVTLLVLYTWSFVLSHEVDVFTPPPHRPLPSFFKSKLGLQSFDESPTISAMFPIGERIDPSPPQCMSVRVKHFGSYFIELFKVNLTTNFVSRPADCVITLLYGGPLVLHLLNPITGSYAIKTLGIADDEEFVFSIAAGTFTASEMRGAEKFPFRYSLVSFIIFPQIHAHELNISTRSELLRQFPQHAEVITRFTPEES